MDIRHILRSSEPRTFRERVGRLAGIAPRLAKEYLEDNPDLVSEAAVSILEEWINSVEQAGSHEDSVNRLAGTKALIQALWRLCVCAPLEIPADVMTFPFRVTHFGELGVRTVGDIATKSQSNPDLAIKLVHVALEHVRPIEWAICVLLATQAADRDIMWEMQNFPEIVEYDAELLLNGYEEWASLRGHEGFATELLQLHAQVSSVRRDVKAGRLRFHDMDLLELVSRYVALDSDDEIESFVEEHPQLLSQAGLDEMKSHMESSNAMHLLGDDLEQLMWSTMLYDLLIRASNHGIRDALRAKPVLPPILWDVAGFLQSGSPSVNDWDAYLRLKIDKPERLAQMAVRVRCALQGRANDGEMPQVAPIYLNEAATAGDYARLDCAVFLELALRMDAQGALCLLRRDDAGRVLSSARDLFQGQYTAGGTSLSDEVINAAVALSESEFRRDLLRVFANHGSRLLAGELTTGHRLLLALGGMASIANDDGALSPALAIPRNSVVESGLALDIIDLVVSSVSGELADKLAAAKVFVARVVKLGSAGAALEAIGTKAQIDRLPQAILAWAGARDYESVCRLLVDYPELATMQAEDFMFEMMGRIDDDDSDSFAHAIKRIEWYLRAKRMGVGTGLARVLPSFESEADNAILERLQRLELCMAVGVWLPLSRYDLSDRFFAILRACIDCLCQFQGSGAALRLETVQARTRHLRQRFGRALGLSRPETDSILRGLYVDQTEEDLHEYISRFESQIVCNYALEVLEDWVESARDSGVDWLADRLVEIGGLIAACQRTSVDLAFLSRHSASGADAALARLRGILRLPSTATRTEIIEAGMAAPATVMIEIEDAMAELLASSGQPDAEERVRHLRILNLPARMEAALKSGAQDYAKLILDEPLFARADADDIARRFFSRSDPRLYALHCTWVRMAQDPLLRCMLSGDIGEEDARRIAQLDRIVLRFVFAGSWIEKFKMALNEPLLSTAAASIRLDMQRSDLERAWCPDGDADDLRAFALVFEEAKAFLERCESVGAVVASNEKLMQATTDEIPEDTVLLLRLLGQLPQGYPAMPAPDEPTYLRWLFDALRVDTIDDEARAELQALIGSHFATEYGRTGQLTSLAKSISHLSECVDLTSPQDAILGTRQWLLASGLLTRFEHFGHDAVDLDSAVLLLEDGLKRQLSRRTRGRLLGELGRALSTRFEARQAVTDLVVATNVLREAITLTPEGSDDWVGWHLNLGATLAELGQATERAQSLEEALRVLESVAGRDNLEPMLEYSIASSMANAMLSYGEMIGVADTVAKAAASFDRLSTSGLGDLQRASALYGKARAIRTLYGLTGKRTYLDESIKLYSDALALHGKDTSDALMCLNGLMLAMRQRAAYDVESADHVESMFEGLLSHASGNEWPRFMAGAAENLGDYFGAKGDFARSRRAYERGLVALERMLESLTTQEDHQYLTAHYEAMVARLVSVTLHDNDPRGAFILASYAKSRELSSNADHDADTRGDSPQIRLIRSEIRDLQSRLGVLRERLAGEEDEMSPAARLTKAGAKDEAAQLADRQRRLASRLKTGSASWFPARTDRFAEYERIQTVLREDAAVGVEYHIGPDGWGAFLLNGEGMHHVHICSDDPPWARWADAMFADKRGPTNTDALGSVLSGIYDLLLAPVFDRLGHIPPRLYYAPTGALSVFPLAAALLASTGQGTTPLAISQVRSLRLASPCSNLAPSLDSVMSVSHDSVTGKMGRIPFARVEGMLVPEMLGAGRHLEGERAVSREICREGSTASTLHFACHGHVDWSNPLASGLVLPRGAWLTGLDILTDLNLSRARLVVLSSCDVGLEVPRPGDEHYGLVSAFMQAGALAVVASLWSANDLATLLLMNRFYTNLVTMEGSWLIARALSGAAHWLRWASIRSLMTELMSIAHILRHKAEAHEVDEMINRASVLLAIQREEHPFGHPYYWGGFQLYGSPQ